MFIKNFKKYLILTISLLFLILILSIPRLKNNLSEGRYYDALRKGGIIKKCYHPNGGDFLKLLGQEKFDYEVLNQQIVKNSVEVLDRFLLQDNIDSKRALKIPAITHHVYFTNENNLKIASYYFLKMIANFDRLSQMDKNWKHFVWTNTPELFPDMVKNYPGVKIKSINEFDFHPLSIKLKKAIKEGQDTKAYFAEAADLMRLLAVEHYGGIYNDMDYEIYDSKTLYHIMQQFDFIAGRETLDLHSYYGNAFFAAKPRHPIIVEALRRIERNFFHKHNDKSMPEYLRYPCREYDRIYFDGPPVITMSYFAMNNLDGNKDLILPPWMVFNVNFIRFKNEFCDYSKIQDQVFVTNNNNLEKIKQLFIDNDVFILESYIKYSKPESIQGADLKIRMSEQNIFYLNRYRKEYPIIGADMFCGGWTNGGKSFKLKNYWKLLD